MRHYAALVRDLHDLVSAVDVVDDSETVWLPDTLVGTISSSQMRAALHKDCAQRVAHLLNQSIPGLEQPAKGDMSNSMPLVEALEYVHTQGLDVHLGWQLQGDQFRRAAVYHDESIKGRGDESRRLREDVSRDHPDFFTFPAVLPQAAGGRGEYNHFAPSFVYNCVKTPSLTIGELKEAAAVVHEDIVRLRDDGDRS